ncbi:Very-long-chain (3R)-3-hydroxyacyl-CoA dehydratase 2 [Galdieria sulphuraria]|nr:Very-long-chain (3R)-3-hydroxyacyl-CoA dehydratase 2 [Galdieria sulphuraria]
MQLRQSYLFLYNFACALGWTYVISRVGKLASIGYGVENTYSVIKQPFIFWQCFQSLEILHAALGIAYHSFGNSWSLAEIPRYLHYALSLTGGRTTVATWLRYSVFLILYPLGAGSEMLLLYKAMPYIRDRGIWSLKLPNKLNFAFDFYKVCWVLLFLYLPGLPFMYVHMLRQRKKYLSNQHKRRSD